MGQTVYVDLFFLINFSMDFLCFFLTSKILNVPLRFWRMIAASVLGGLYADAALFLPLGRGAALGVDFAACAIICTAALWKPRESRSLPLYILVYTAVSMTLGGFMTAFFNLLNRSRWFSGTETPDGDGISVWLFAALAAVSGVITFLSGKFFCRQSARKTANVTFYYGGKSVRLSAMTDNGNLLRDPLSGKLCMVADTDALRRLLPSDLWQMAKRGDAASLEKVSAQHARKIRLIPARTATGAGLLVALRMERITVDGGRGEREVDAMVALTDLGKSAEGKQVLLPAELLMGT